MIKNTIASLLWLLSKPNIDIKEWSLIEWEQIWSAVEREAKQLGGTTRESGVVEEFQLETDSILDADDLKSNEFIEEIVYFVWITLR